jgi:hypothetical protein
MERAIRWCLTAGIAVRRPSKHQLKIGKLNYYPVKGTLQYDEERAMSERGFEAFQKLARQ